MEEKEWKHFLECSPYDVTIPRTTMSSDEGRTMSYQNRVWCEGSSLLELWIVTVKSVGKRQNCFAQTVVAHTVSHAATSESKKERPQFETYH